MSGCTPQFSRFHLVREVDETGVSGTGLVAEGVRFRDGRVAMRWCVNPARSTTTYDCVKDVETIHGHDGKTRVVFLDEAGALGERADAAQTPGEPTDECTVA